MKVKMSFINKIQSEMYASMKQGDKIKSATLRALLAKLKDRQIDNGEDLSEKDSINVIKTLVKQRKESIDLYQKAGRDDLSEKELKELKILEHYLPRMMSDEEIRELVLLVVEETGATDMSDVGKVMPIIMQRGSENIDGKIANTILRELLA